MSERHPPVLGRIIREAREFIREPHLIPSPVIVEVYAANNREFELVAANRDGTVVGARHLLGETRPDLFLLEDGQDATPPSLSQVAGAGRVALVSPLSPGTGMWLRLIEEVQVHEDRSRAREVLVEALAVFMAGKAKQDAFRCAKARFEVEKGGMG